MKKTTQAAFSEGGAKQSLFGRRIGPNTTTYINYKPKKQDMKKAAFVSGAPMRRRPPKMVKQPPVVNKQGDFIKGSIATPVAAVVSAGLARVASKGFRTVAGALGEELLNQATIRGKYELKRILNPPGLSGRPDRTIPCLTVNGTQAVKNMGTVEPKLSHRTKVQTGNPTSRTLLELAKENGVETRVLFDSKMSTRTTEEADSADVVDRRALSHSCGFNCRNFSILPQGGWVTQNDVLTAAFPRNNDLVGSPPLVGLGIDKVNSSEKIYGSLLSTFSELQIFNQSRFLPLVCKIHIVCANRPVFNSLAFQSNPGEDITEKLIKLTDEGPDGFPQETRSGIPGYYLLEEARSSFLNGRFGAFYDWNQLNSGKGLMDSPYFRDNYTIVETKQKTLEPNDSWQFKHEHQYGGGIDFSVLVNNLQEGGNFAIDQGTPISYFYIIETKGLPCEGVERDLDGNPSPRFGTSPGYYFVEMRKSIKFVRGADDTFEIDPGEAISSGTTGGTQERRMHIRVFTKNDVGFLGNLPGNPRPFHRLPTEIGTGIDSSFFIPIEVESTLSSEGAASRSRAADNDPFFR